MSNLIKLLKHIINFYDEIIKEYDNELSKPIFNNTFELNKYKDNLEKDREKFNNRLKYFKDVLRFENEIMDFNLDLLK